MEVHLVRSWFVTLGQVALAVIVVLVALVLVAGTSGSARVPGTGAAVVAVAAGVFLIRGLRRQAVVVDGDRLGWRRGLTDRITGWTRLSDVVAVTGSKVSSSISLRERDVVLWTPEGGLGGVGGWLARSQLSAEQRRTLDAAAGPGGRVRPFIVPYSALREPDREALAALLEQHGLRPR